jgi:hypothetical protein
MGEHATATHAGIERTEGVEGTAHLERASRLQVLGFEPQWMLVVGPRTGQQRSSHDLTVDPVSGGADVVEPDESDRCTLPADAVIGAIHARHHPGIIIRSPDRSARWAGGHAVAYAGLMFARTIPGLAP